MPESDGAEAGKFCCGLCCFLFLTVCVPVFACSFAVLYPRDYSVVYDNTYKSLQRAKGLEGGRYFIGPHKSFIIYPRGVVGYYFVDLGGEMSEKFRSWQDWGGLSVWSKNGQELTIGISLQVVIKFEQLPKLYMMYGTDPWNPLRVSLVRAIKDRTVDFNTLDFFTERVEVKASLLASVINELKKDDLFEIALFNVRSIDIPTAFDSAVLQKLLTYQAFKRASFQQNVTRLVAGLEETKQRGESDALLRLTNATATGDYRIAVGKAQMRAEIYRTRARMYKDMMDRLAWTGDPELGRRALHFYLWNSLSKQSDAISPRIGMSEAKIVTK